MATDPPSLHKYIVWETFPADNELLLSPDRVALQTTHTPYKQEHKNNDCMYITCVGNHELIMLVSIVSCSCDSAVLAAFTSAGHSLLSAHTSDISSPLSPGGGED